MVELLTGKPIFNARDENELIEMIHFKIGLPPEHMLRNATKRYQFFESEEGHIIRSKKSRIPADAAERTRTIRMELYEDGKINDEQLIDFVE